MGKKYELNNAHILLPNLSVQVENFIGMAVGLLQIIQSDFPKNTAKSATKNHILSVRICELCCAGRVIAVFYTQRKTHIRIRIGHYFNFQFILYQRQLCGGELISKWFIVLFRCFIFFSLSLSLLLLSFLLALFVCWLVWSGKLFAGRLILDYFFLC